MKISSAFAAAVTLLAGKASASTPTRLRAMTEDIATDATSASTGIAGMTEDDLQDKVASLNLNPFFQALLKPENATESQFFDDLMAEDELSDQFDFIDAAGTSSMSMATAGSTTANTQGGVGNVGWSSKRGKGNDCSIEKMRGSYLFEFDLWVAANMGGGHSDLTQGWESGYMFRDTLLLFDFGPPMADFGDFGPPKRNGRGKNMGAMVGTLGPAFDMCTPDKEAANAALPYVIAVQTGVAEEDVVPFQIEIPEFAPFISAQGEFNCKTEEVYFGLSFTLSNFGGLGDGLDGGFGGFALGFTTRKPAKKQKNLHARVRNSCGK